MFNKKIFNGHYKSDKETKQEFVNFLEWYKLNKIKYQLYELELNDTVETYLKDKNIALTGIRKLYGAYTRNASFELFMTICSAIVGLIISTAIYFYFL